MSLDLKSDLFNNLRLELRRGLLIVAVLAQLRREHYGYTLRKDLAALGIEIDEGTLYPLLRRLESQGLLESEWGVSDNHRRAKYFRLDRTAGQTNHLVVLCEAAGMAPQLAEVTGPYDIKVMSGGGFDSLTAKYEFATELACPPQARAKALDQIAANVSWLSRKYPERPMEVRELYDILQRLADVIITPDLVQ